jgi:outer membrane protein assembly factor BamD (BamD/ComL family)
VAPAAPLAVVSADGLESGRAPSSRATDGLREQAALLDHARAQLEAGDPQGALGSLDVYDRRFAGSPLAEESIVLRIDALARRGDRAGAATVARRFLRTHPSSVHADRVAALLRGLSP